MAINAFEFLTASALCPFAEAAQHICGRRLGVHLMYSDRPFVHMGRGQAFFSSPGLAPSHRPGGTSGGGRGRSQGPVFGQKWKVSGN